MPNNKVSPETTERTPLIREAYSSTSINHFDDDGPTIEYSKAPVSRKRGSSLAKMRQETIFDFSSLLEPISFNIDNNSQCSSPVEPGVSVELIEKCNRQKIMNYLAHLQSQSNQSEVDLSELDRLLAMGADVNACTDKGLTPLHQSVIKFPLSVTHWLIDNGAKIETVDYWGWTALHLACIENRPDIISLLCKLSYKLLHYRTDRMLLSPLHIAALSDTNDVIIELVHYMKISLSSDPDRESAFREWLESRDYQGRTALHLATQYERSTSARYLLEHSLSYAATFDSYDQFCMVQMIEKMSFVSNIALDQFYVTDVLSRKQLFYLQLLEKKTNLDVTRTPLDSIVQFKRFELVLHPIFRKLLKVKWRMYGRAFAIFQLIFYLINLTFWSLFAIHPPKQEKYIYNLPTDIWRIVVGFLCFAFLFFQIVEEITELTKDISEERHFAKKMNIIYKKDKKSFPDYLTTEHEHIKSLMKDLNRLKNPYIGDFWNYIDWLAYFLMTATAVTHIVDIAAHSTILAEWHARISVITLILIWFRLLKYLRPFEFIGWFIAILIYLKSDIFRFLIFIVTLVIPYSLGFWILFRSLNEDLHSFPSTVFTVFRMIVVDDYPFHIIRDQDEWMTYFIVGTYIAIVSIVSLNLFIALLSNTFQTIYDNSQATAIMEKARLLLSTEKKLPYQFLKYYYNRIHDKCSPLIENFDEGAADSGGERAIKLATLNILSKVNGMNDTLEEFVKHSKGRQAHHEVEDEQALSATRFENLLFALNENISNVAASVDTLNKRVGRMEVKLDSTATIKPNN
ncbi:Transient receptor potential channel pyrexia-like [Oopsacas minuta]|uniref:Transient receptor potential channel pyrexia-like n=1 Tax=Oopsacas minuta TaxID=111878 RepID=A0AAV7JSL9_9METZ|nr:Transient receptor potential channel pyrexia-like [Oopsacas minuta]